MYGSPVQIVVSSGRAGEAILQDMEEMSEMRERLLAARIVH
jgi:hypothetical protein